MTKPTQKLEVLEFSHYMLELLFQRIDVNKLMESFEDLEIEIASNKFFDFECFDDKNGKITEFISILYHDDNLKYFGSLKDLINSRVCYDTFVDYLIDDFSYNVLAYKSGENLDDCSENLFVKKIIKKYSNA